MAKQFVTIRNWFGSPRGAAFLQEERLKLEDAFCYYMGHCVLWYGNFLGDFISLRSGTEKVVVLGQDQKVVDVVCEEQSWPIYTEGVEVVVLQHSLECAVSPHDLLREAVRCVRPGGHLLIVGFNPSSWWRFYRLFRRDVFEHCHNISRKRLIDWLRVLGFRVEKQWMGGEFFPSKVKPIKVEENNDRRWFQDQYYLNSNGFYMVSARKMMMQLPPITLNKKPVLSGFKPLVVRHTGDMSIDERKG